MEKINNVRQPFQLLDDLFILSLGSETRIYLAIF